MPAAVRHAGDEDARGVDADGGLELVERALEDLDVVGAAGACPLMFQNAFGPPADG